MHCNSQLLSSIAYGNDDGNKSLVSKIAERPLTVAGGAICSTAYQPSIAQACLNFLKLKKWDEHGA